MFEPVILYLTFLVKEVIINLSDMFRQGCCFILFTDVVPRRNQQSNRNFVSTDCKQPVIRNECEIV
jgi:hypothetical protein